MVPCAVRQLGSNTFFRRMRDHIQSSNQHGLLRPSSLAVCVELQSATRQVTYLPRSGLRSLSKLHKADANTINFCLRLSSPTKPCYLVGGLSPWSPRAPVYIPTPTNDLFLLRNVRVLLNFQGEPKGGDLTHYMSLPFPLSFSFSYGCVFPLVHLSLSLQRDPFSRCLVIKPLVIPQIFSHFCA